MLLIYCASFCGLDNTGDPRVPGTLHYIHPDGSLNDYEKAITAIGSILMKYDTDKKFPVIGFGAKYGGVLHNCFQCGPTQEASGISGVLEAYRSVFKTALTMSGPTLFQDVIQFSAKNAVKEQVCHIPPCRIRRRCLQSRYLLSSIYSTFCFRADRKWQREKGDKHTLFFL